MRTEKMKVLVVEDNPGDLRLLEETLKEHGKNDLNLLVENNLEKALKQISSEEIDAILLDLSLPESSGLETLAHIQEADSITPIIVLTGMNDEITALQAIRLGAQDYLVKDRLDGDALVRALRYSVERNRYGLLRKMDILKDEASPDPQGGEKRLPKSLAQVNSIDLADILENEKVIACFQPWVSLKKQAIVGVEGLCRGLDRDSKTLISPTALLRMASRWKLLNALDRLFREKVFEEFAPFSAKNPDLVLSVNFDASVLNNDENSLEDFPALARKYQLNPARIAIEILESRTRDIYRLKSFIETQRSYGFLIALDDIGSGYSNLERVAELKPDIIKTDRSLIIDIDQSYHKQEVFKSMVRLAHSIGALVVAEGAETEMEALRALELGSDMIQGFYFAEPGKIGEKLLSSCEEKIDAAAKKFKSYIIKNINTKRINYRTYDVMISLMVKDLASTTPKSFDAKLLDILNCHPEVDALFILDEAGTQMSRMVTRGHTSNPDKVFFKLSERGSNHSLKDYYYYLVESDLKEYTFVTEPYLSMVTGRTCVTISTLFKDAYGHNYILCVDVKPENLLV